MKYVQIVFQNR